jgi:hypothetical protein
MSMFVQIDKMVEELNEEYSIHLATARTETSVYIEFVDHPFVKKTLCSVYVEEDDNFRFIHNGIDITSNDITQLKTLIETEVFKQHFTLAAAITKMINHYFNHYLVSEVGTNQSTTKGIIKLPVKTHEGTNFNLIVNRHTGEVRAESDTSEMVYVSNTPTQIVMIDQTIHQTIEQLLTMISKHSDVQLPSPAILKNTQKSLHDYRNKGFQQILAFRGSYILSHIFYSYLISKYKNTCNKIENNPDFFIAQTGGTELEIQKIKSAENVAHCINHDKLSMFIIPLTIYGGEEGAHANLLVYRRKFHTLEHFEPNGANMPYSEPYLVNFNAQLQQYIDIINSKIPNKLEYIGPSKICPGKGLQWLEGNSKLLLTDNEPGGYCLVWSMFFAELCLKNPDKTSDELLRYVFKTMPKNDDTNDDLRRICQGYVHIIYDKINKYVSQHFPDIKLNKGMTRDDLALVIVKLDELLDISGDNPNKTRLSDVFRKADLFSDISDISDKNITFRKKKVVNISDISDKNITVRKKKVVNISDISDKNITFRKKNFVNNQSIPIIMKQSKNPKCNLDTHEYDENGVCRKKCPDGSTRHPTTKRCRKIIVQSNTSVACGKGIRCKRGTRCKKGYCMRL